MPIDGPHESEPAQPDVTVVLPFYNRRAQIGARYTEITTALANHQYELIAIDDGSIDGGFDLLRPLALADQRLRLVRLRRSFGQTAALAAGFERARGRVIVTLDADGLTDPHDLPRLLEQIEQGYDIVSGWRDVPRALPTRLGNQLIAAVTGVQLHDYGCPLKAYRTDVVREMHLYGDLYRFAPAIASWHGAQICEIRVRERPNASVRPGTGLRRVFGILIDLITVHFLLSYSARPMQAIGRIGGILLLLAGVIGVYLGYVKLWLGQDIGNRPLTVLAVLLVVLATQLVMIGLLAELAVRNYHESQNKPIYVVREEIGIVDSEPELQVDGSR